jgi:5-hydroxyisourate hydrolase
MVRQDTGMRAAVDAAREADMQGRDDGTPTLSTHVLDTRLGQPAAGVRVRLEHVLADGAVVAAGEGVTDPDGRVRRLARDPLRAGVYRLVVDLHELSGFFGTLIVEIHVDDASRSYHVPLLVSPFGITLYRGS